MSGIHNGLEGSMTLRFAHLTGFVFCLSLAVEAVELEEVVVQEIRNPRLNMEMITDAYQARQQGLLHYRLKNYEKAFPYLEFAARAGLKDTQALMGEMYLKGLSVKQDNVRAIGWIGVAAEEKAMPVVRNVFKRMRDQVPAEKIADFDRVVTAYRNAYGKVATRVHCDSTSVVGTLRKGYECYFRDEDTFEGFEEGGLDAIE